MLHDHRGSNPVLYPLPNPNRPPSRYPEPEPGSMLLVDASLGRSPPSDSTSWARRGKPRPANPNPYPLTLTITVTLTLTPYPPNPDPDPDPDPDPNPDPDHDPDPDPDPDPIPYRATTRLLTCSIRPGPEQIRW